tara:strand:- start:911 stop:1396 length:486 start_codon:yes stop_codon:yes gene_type:complete
MKKIKKKIYYYHRVDSRYNINLYQYSKYYGFKFIKDFFKSRKKILDLKKEKNQIFIKKKINFNEIKNLCRKYELNKKLFLDKEKKKEFKLNHYIHLSKIISMYLIRKQNYSILSTLLKLNDLIIYLFTNKKNKLVNFKDLKKAINLEILIINRLVYEKKIK